MSYSHKTKTGALRAARKSLGERAVEGVDFTLRNTGAGWIILKIPPANKAAAEAQAKRRTARKPQPVEEGAGNRQRGARAGHHNRQAAAEARSFKPAQTRTEQLVQMMSRPQGATSKAMEEATGWAPHSVRGLIGALKKRGVQVISDKVQGSPTAYRITPKPDEIGDVL